MKLCLRCNQYFEDGIELCPIDTSLLESVGDHPLIGALINDRYVVDSVIGKGSSGIVYKATRLLMGREVAVKVLHSYLGAESGALDRFLREARAASRLRHPHIINIWESGVTDDAQPYFVMDYLEGMTLADLIHEKGFIHAGRAMPIVTQVCEALAEAHKQGIVHRDIKPENIVLQANEGDNNFDDYVKVLDFGIADQTTSLPGQIRQRTAAGSPAYMSPEQCQGFELDIGSDIYSLAIVIFEMLTGSRPFIADDVMKLFYMHVQQPPPTLSSIRADLKFNPSVEAVMAKALSKKASGRQQSIKEFQKELEDAFNNKDASQLLAVVGKRKESVPVDLFSVPVSDRLMDGSRTGTHNFLPGPEDWAEPEPENMPNMPAYAAPAPVMMAKSDGPDVSAAVGRLLKSARRASEALKRDSNDAHDWAKSVAQRSDDATTGGSPADQPGPTPTSPSRQLDQPEVANWAEKVRKRPAGVSSSDELAAYSSAHAGAPENLSTRLGATAPEVPPEANATRSVPEAPRLPTAREGAPPEKFGRITKPSDFLKAKSAEARQASAQSNDNIAAPTAPNTVTNNDSQGLKPREPAESGDHSESEAPKREGFLRSSRPVPAKKEETAARLEELPPGPNRQTAPPVPNRDLLPPVPNRDLPPPVPNRDLPPPVPNRDLPPPVPSRTAAPQAPNREAPPQMPSREAPKQPNRPEPTSIELSTESGKKEGFLRSSRPQPSEPAKSQEPANSGLAEESAAQRSGGFLRSSRPVPPRTDEQIESPGTTSGAGKASVTPHAEESMPPEEKNNASFEQAGNLDSAPTPSEAAKAKPDSPPTTQAPGARPSPPAAQKPQSIADVASRLLSSLKKDVPPGASKTDQARKELQSKAGMPKLESGAKEPLRTTPPDFAGKDLPAKTDIPKPSSPPMVAGAGEIKKMPASEMDALSAYEKQTGASLGKPPAFAPKNPSDLPGKGFATQPSFLHQKPAEQPSFLHQKPADQSSSAPQKTPDQQIKELQAKNAFAQEVDQRLPSEKSEIVQSQETAKPYLDPSRFDQPVNKNAESTNKFSEAIEVLLDNAIMPKTTEYTRRSLSKIKKFEVEGTASGATSPENPVLPPSVGQAKGFSGDTSSGATREPASASAYEGPSAAETKTEPKKPVLDRSRFDQPINRGQLASSGENSPVAKQGFPKQEETGRIDLKKFDQSINKIPPSGNPLAEAIDNALDSAMIKREPPSFMQFKRNEPAVPDQEAASSTSLPPIPPPISPPAVPPASLSQSPQLLAPEPSPNIEPSKEPDAVSRLIEAAKKAPEAGATAKPEAYNRKVEEIRKKIEALKVADANKPVGGLPPDQATSSIAPGDSPYVAPPNRQPSFAPAAQDPNALSDAVNRLLEAAQRQESANFNTPVSQNEQSKSYNNAPTFNSGAPVANTSRFGTPPNPFDPGASTAMNVTPFGQMSEQVSQTDGRQEPPKKPSETSPMKSFTNIQSEQTIRAAELINAVRSNKASGEPAPDYYSGYVSEVKANKAGSIRESRKSMRKGFQGRPRLPLWLSVILLGAVLVWFAYFFKWGPFEKASAPMSVDAWIKANRPEKARELLETRKKAGNLTQADNEKLNEVYVKCATKLAADGDFTEATRMLKLVPSRSRSYESARKLIKEYRHSTPPGSDR